MISQGHFDSLSQKLFSALNRCEALTINLVAESSHFVRLNLSRVRQLGTVADATLDLQITFEKPDGLSRCSGAVTLSGDLSTDLQRATLELDRLQKEVRALPINPYLPHPANHGRSSEMTEGVLLAPDRAVPALLDGIGGASVTGIYASGRIIRANSNSLGQRHWFETDQYSFDYSVDSGSESAVKGEISGSSWSQEEFSRQLAESHARTEILRRPPRSIPRGTHRVYLAPAAVADLIGMFSWGCISEAAIRQGDSPLARLRRGDVQFSRQFSLREDFTGGGTPRFNDDGELAPESISLIREGSLESTLVSSATAREYGVVANGAARGEWLRSPWVLPGRLSEDKVLEALGTGLYLSNLHYLNWSDQPGGRVTGMTRHACFWVDDGKLTAPIVNLRWDDSIFQLFGERLEALSHRSVLMTETGTYGHRHLRSVRVPGALVSGMDFTL